MSGAGLTAAHARTMLMSLLLARQDCTVSVVSFDIAGTLKQKVGVALPALAAQPPKCDLTSRESSEILVADSVGR